ncbi:hypothetical protein AHAS_Ahas13G0518500 [Arachis hypogaea]
MKEIGAMMEKFAKHMRVPFKFNVIHHSGHLSEFNFGELNIRDDETLVVNCVNVELSVKKRGTCFLLGIRT